MRFEVPLDGSGPPGDDDFRAWIRRCTDEGTNQDERNREIVKPKQREEAAMKLTTAQKKEILKLSGLGNMATRIWAEHFPKHKYTDVLGVILGARQKTALGNIKTINNRCKKVAADANVDPKLKKRVAEIHRAANQLYDTIRKNRHLVGKVSQIHSQMGNLLDI